MKIYNDLAQLYLRIAIGIAYFVFGLDRLGAWGMPGDSGVSWGDWPHFLDYAKQVMSFLPASMVEVFAVVATGAEIVLGILLPFGKWTKLAAIGSGVLSFLFALSMAISFGFVSPLSYSVFTLSAGSFLLSTLPGYRWSLDELFMRN